MAKSWLNEVEFAHSITAKHRRKVMYCKVREDLQKFIKGLCKWRGVEILEVHMMPDLLLSIPPKIRVSDFMGNLKGESAMMIFDRHAKLKYKYGNRHFWATGYYINTVSLNEKTITKYIREQDKQDHIVDKITTKE